MPLPKLTHVENLTNHTEGHTVEGEGWGDGDGAWRAAASNPAPTHSASGNPHQLRVVRPGLPVPGCGGRSVNIGATADPAPRGSCSRFVRKAVPVLYVRDQTAQVCVRALSRPGTRTVGVPLRPTQGVSV